MGYLNRVNNRNYYKGLGIVGDSEYVRPSCPSSLTFDNSHFTFDSICRIWSLGDPSAFQFDTTLVDFSSTTATFDEV